MNQKNKDKKTKKIDWLYPEPAQRHFFKPQNFLRPGQEKKLKYNAYGRSGSPACGDLMEFWLLIDAKTKKIKDCKWRTFGCGSAIASASALSEMILEKGGMTIAKALEISPEQISKRLGGLPKIKFHCSILGDEALKNAAEEFEKNLKFESKKRIIKRTAAKGLIKTKMKKIIVDPKKCIGCGACAFFAPKSFKINSSGKSEPINPAKDSEEKIKQAEQNCPADAIRLE